MMKLVKLRYRENTFDIVSYGRSAGFVDVSGKLPKAQLFFDDDNGMTAEELRQLATLMDAIAPC